MNEGWEYEGWEWIIAPYGWASTVGTHLEIDVAPAGGISTDTDFG